MDFEGNAITFSLPQLSWEMITVWNIVIANAVYGFLTHMVSLPGIRRYNATHDTKVSDRALFVLFLTRMTIQLPYRIINFVMGVIVVICTWNFKNEALLEGWHWHANSVEVAEWDRKGR